MLNSSKLQDQTIAAEFADTHGFSYQPSGSTKDLIGSLFGTGLDKEITDTIIGNDNGSPWRLFNYVHTIGFGRDQTTLQFTVLDYDLQTGLPQLLIKPTSQTKDLIVEAPSGYTYLPLEGNFDEKLHLFVAPGNQLNALEILAPNVMIFLLDSNEHYDIEFADNHLLVFQKDFADSTASLDSLLSFGKSLAAQIRPTADRMHFIGKPVKSVLRAARWRAIGVTILAVLIISFIFFGGMWLLLNSGL